MQPHTFSDFISHGAAMEIAIQKAWETFGQGEIPVGAVILQGGKSLGAFGNSCLSCLDPTAHAEINAIRAACQHLGSHTLEGCTLVVTLEPCALCAAAVSLARIKTLVFGAYSPKTGAVDHGPRFFSQKTCLHKPDVIGGLRERECADLLTHFFQQRRGGVPELFA